MNLRIPFRSAQHVVTAAEAQQARIDKRLRAIEHQGRGSALFAHWLAYLLVVAFSAGALVALAGDAVRTFLTQAHAGVIDIPSLISFVVSFVLVFAMDTSMVIAATTVRMLRQRHQQGAGLHLAMIAGVCLIESATYLYMSYVYDHPASVVAWAILTARAVAAPIMAVYLSLARTLPISARDINTQVEVVTGRGVLVEMTRIADDPAATTERKVALYQASALMDPADEQRLARIIAAERVTRDATSDATSDARRALGETTPAPSPQPAPQPAAARSNHDLRRLRLKRDMEPDETTDDDTDDDGVPDWGAVGGADDLGAYDDDLIHLRQPHVTSPRPRASFQQQRAAQNGATPARMSPRFSEMVVDLPEGKTARRDDSPEARRVMNYLDKHPGAIVSEVVAKTKVSKPTVRRYYTAWVERNRKSGENAAPFTEEMPAITAEQLAEQLNEQAAGV